VLDIAVGQLFDRVISFIGTVRRRVTALCGILPTEHSGAPAQLRRGPADEEVRWLRT